MQKMKFPVSYLFLTSLVCFQNEKESASATPPLDRQTDYSIVGTRIKGGQDGFLHQTYERADR